MNFKKIVFFVTFVLPSALFTSDRDLFTSDLFTSDLDLFTSDLDLFRSDRDLFTSDHSRSDHSTSDHSSKKRKVEETDENTLLEKTNENMQPKEAVQLSEKFYKKGEVLNFFRKPSFTVLADGPALNDYVYVKHKKTNKNGLFNIRTQLFAVGYTYETVDQLLEYLKKRDSFF